MPSTSTWIVSEPAGTSSDDVAAAANAACGTCVIVADGAGGTGNGFRTAEFVVARILEQLEPLDEPPAPESLANMLRELDRELVSTQLGGESTVVALVIGADDFIAGASVGDSVAWLIRPDGISDLTRMQAIKPLLGSGLARPVSFFHRRLDAPLLVATDGFWKYAKRESVHRAILSNAELEEILDAARLPNGKLQDDTTFVLCRPDARERLARVDTR